MTTQDTFREAYEEVVLKVHELLSIPGNKETFRRHFKEYEERSSGERQKLAAKYTRLAVLHGRCFPDEAIDPLIISDELNKTWSVATHLALSAGNKKNRAITRMNLKADLIDVEADLKAKATGEDGGKEQDKKLPPSRAMAAVAYDYALDAIEGADKMTVAKLFVAIQSRLDSEIAKAHGEQVERLSEFRDTLPDNAETFGKYLRDAGIKKYNSRGDKVPGRSIRRQSVI